MRLVGSPQPSLGSFPEQMTAVILMAVDLRQQVQAQHRDLLPDDMVESVP